MQMFSYPAMPMYTHDHADYYRKMHDWHMGMMKYHDEQRAHHMERAKHFKQLMGGQVVPMERPSNGVA